MDLENAYDKIYRYVYFRIKDRATAEDITQEAFLRLISQKGDLHGYDIRYLYVIARNLCIDEYRRAKPEALPEDYEETAGGEEEALADRLAVREAVAELPPEDQELLLLRHVNGESMGTISNTLGISRFALYRRLKGAEAKLRRSLEGDKDEK